MDSTSAYTNSVMQGFRQVGFFTAISRISGLVRDVCLALVLGAGAASDAFLVALKIPNFFRRITAEGALTNAFLPAYEKEVAETNKKKALHLVTEVQILLVISLSCIVILFELLMPFIIQFLAPGFRSTADRLAAAVFLARITMPYLIMISLVALWSALLNAHRIFWPGAAAPILLNLALILGAVFVLLSMGNLSEETINALTVPLALSVLVSGLLQLLLLKIVLLKTKLNPSWRWVGITNSGKQMWRSFAPAALSAGSVQINIFVDMILASLLQVGAISWLYYSDRINQLPLGIIGIALGTALLPHLSQLYANGKTQEMRDSLSNSFYLASFFTLPAATALIILSSVIISGVFGHGAFEETDVEATAKALVAYAVGLPAFVAQKLFQVVFYASNRPSTILMISSITVFTNIIFSIILMQFIGHIGLALGSSISIWGSTFYLAYLLMKEGYLTKNSFVSLSPVIMFCILMGTLLIILENWLTKVLFLDIIVLVLLVVSGLISYLGMAYLTGCAPKGLTNRISLKNEEKK